MTPRRSVLSVLLFTGFTLASICASAQRPGSGPNTSNAGAANWDSVEHSNTFNEVSKPTTAEDEGKVKYRSETTLIQVPVVITDKSGNHVHGLMKDNFHVTENGREQKIATFEEFVASTTKLTPAPTQPGEYSNLAVSPSAKEPRAVTVIAIDTVNTPFLDQALGRHALIKYLADNIDTSQTLALVLITSRGVHVVQGLTGDPQVLLQALKKVSGEIPQSVDTSVDIQANAVLGNIPQQNSAVVAASNTNSLTAVLAAVQVVQDYADTQAAQFQQARAIDMTMHGFLGIAWALSGVPGRKSIIWCTSGFPFVLNAPDVVPGNLGPLYERTVNALLDGQISVYPVDVRGIMTRGEGDVTPGPVGDLGHGISGDRRLGQQNEKMQNRAWLISDSYQSLNEFADMTGGKAFYNTNDLAGSFKRAADDSSSYYLVGYYLDTKNNRAGWRQLKVNVDKSDVEIRARKGFFVTNATVQPDSTRDYDLQTALTSPIDGTGIPVSLKWTGISGSGDKKKANFLVEIPPNAVTIEGGQQSHLKFDVAVSAYSNSSKDSKPVLTFGQTVDTAITPQQLAQVQSKGITIAKNMDVAPGEYTVRLVVRDSVTGKVGSVTAPLTVN
jgi:VWFA-related protein